MNPCASDWWGWEVVASSNTPLACFHTLLMNFLCKHTSLLLGLFVLGSFLKLKAFYDAVRDPTSALRSAPVGPRAPVRQSVRQPLLPPLDCSWNVRDNFAFFRPPAMQNYGIFLLVDFLLLGGVCIYI